jgi:hypothetical protein
MSPGHKISTHKFNTSQARHINKVKKEQENQTMFSDGLFQEGFLTDARTAKGINIYLYRFLK